MTHQPGVERGLRPVELVPHLLRRLVHLLDALPRLDLRGQIVVGRDHRHVRLRLVLQPLQILRDPVALDLLHTVQVVDEEHGAGTSLNFVPFGIAPISAIHCGTNVKFLNSSCLLLQSLYVRDGSIMCLTKPMSRSASGSVMNASLCNTGSSTGCPDPSKHG
jgi:hypothetical protein